MLKVVKKFYVIALFLFSLFVITGCTKEESKIDDVFNQLFLNENLTAVESDLSFPKSLNGVNISYVSNNPEVVSNEGKVTRQKENITVEVTITLNDGKKEEVKKVTIIVLKKDDKLEQVFQSLFGNLDLSNVTNDLTLLTSMDGVAISYQSDKPNVLSNTGKVNRDVVDQNVKLTVTLKANDEELTKVLDITVIKKEISKIQDVANNLFKDVDLKNVTTDLDLPLAIDGVTITYQSDKPEFLSDTGKVNRDLEDQLIVLTVTLKENSVQIIKTFNINIIKREMSIVEAAATYLFYDIDLQNVKTDLSFPSSMSWVMITYQSDNPDVLSNTGKVNRGDITQNVKLTVNFKYDKEELTKVYDIKVIKKNKANVVAENLFKDVDINNVTADLDLPSTIDGVTLTWNSSDPSVLTNTGKVTRTGLDESVSLTVKIEYEDEVITKIFDITIPKDNQLYLEFIYSNLFKTDLTKVTKNLSFPRVVDDVNITYESNNPEVISDTGVIKRGNQDEQVTIKITLTYEDVTVIKEASMTVLKADTYPIINAINAGVNDIVTVQGIAIGFVGDSVYIHDGTDGIYLYKVGAGYQLGDLIKITGYRSDFNGFIQIQNHSSVTVINRNVQLPTAINITTFNEINKQSTLYNISDLTVTKFDNIKSGTDVFITVKDSMNAEMDIIISKHIKSSDVANIANKLGDISVGDKITLTNIISGYYKKYQFQLFSPDQITIKHLADDPIVTDPIDPYYPDPADMKFLQDELDKYLTSGITPEGEANVLIIPVNFIDYTISSENLERLETAFFGTSEETGWESVRSFYEKSSYGKFNFNGRILEPFQTNKPSTYYAKKYNSGIDADYEIIKAVLEYYDATIDYSQYDNNNDGYIDGLYFIYAAPTWYGEKTGSDNDSDLWWAYVYQYYTEVEEYYDGVEANYYLWAGIDFIDEAFIYDDYTDDYIEVNAVTYIHETGHMLGLYDYYDYEEGKGPEGGLGGADMMDYNVGDHNSFSKIMLNWVTPLVVSGKSTTVTLESFTESGDVVLVSCDWNNTYFDEYFLIEFYTPTSLNEAHAGFNGLYTIYGIRILHVNAAINPNQQSNGELFLYNNSDTTKKILKPIEADNDNSIEEEMIAENEDLFLAGDEFGSSTNYRLANGRLVNFNIKVINITNESAQIEIIFN